MHKQLKLLKKIAHENSLRVAAEQAALQVREDEKKRAKSLRDLIEQEARDKKVLEDAEKLRVEVEKLIRTRIKDKEKEDQEEDEEESEEIISTSSNLTGPSLFAVPVLVWVISVPTAGAFLGPFVGPAVGVIYVAVTATKIIKNYKKNNGGGGGGGDDDDDKDKKKKKSKTSQIPEQQGCGGKSIDNGPKILTSPAPEIKDPNHGGCGKPDPDASKIPTHTGHGQQPEISQDLPGCGGKDIPKNPDFLQAGKKEDLLPKSGDYPFKAPKTKDGKIPRNKEGHYIDDKGYGWKWDPNKKEWDVQTNKGHRNVNPAGIETHAGSDPASKSGTSKSAKNTKK